MSPATALRTTLQAAVLLLGPLIAACATTESTEVMPASSAAGLPVPGPSAVASAAGVRLAVLPSVEHPRELGRPVSPLFVEIHNDSARDLVVRPAAFHLVTPTGTRYQAIPPESLRQSEASPASADVAIAIRALQRDVLRAGARAEGFVYFAEFEEPGPLTLTFELVAQGDTAAFGLITLALTRQTNHE